MGLFFDKTVIWDRTPPQLYINCSVYVWGRAQGSQIFKWNSIISICSKVMAFLVILLSLWSPSSPHRPHSPQKSSCGPHHPCHPCCPHCTHPCCPRHPCHPHIVPIIPTSSLSSPHHLEGPQIISNSPDRHITHLPPLWGVGDPKSLKMQ